MPAGQRFVLQDGTAIAARDSAFDALADYFPVFSSAITAMGTPCRRVVACHSPIPSSEDYKPDNSPRARQNVLLDPDELHFAPPLIPFPTETNDKTHNGSAAKNGNGRTLAISEVIRQTTARIHARHPHSSEFLRCDCSAAQVEKLLAAILKHQHVQTDEKEAFLQRIDQTHAAMCSSEQ